MKSRSVKSIRSLFIIVLLAGVGVATAAGGVSGTALGVLSFLEAKVDDPGLSGAASVALSPDGAHVYVVGQSDNAVAVLRRDNASGRLSWVEAQRDGVGGVDGLFTASSVTVSPDGAHVYVAGYNDDAVAVFGRDSATGKLTFVEAIKDGDIVDSITIDGLDGAWSVTVSPDGAHVYVASWDDNAVAVFGRDSSSGALTFVEVIKDGDVVSSGTVDGLLGANSVTVSPDGAHVYVTGSGDDAVAVFGRDSSSGALSFVEAIKDGDIVGSITIDGLAGAWSVTVSPDGAHVYVASWDDNAVAAFARDGATGKLTFVEVEWDNFEGVDGLGAARSVAVSPDGAHVYVASQLDNAVAVFARNSSSGVLTYIGVEIDGVGGVDGLLYAYSVAVSPDGAHVYVAGWGDNAVTTFARDGSSGALAYVDMYENVQGLDGAFSVAVSPDGEHVYATGVWDNAVTLFRRDSSGELTYLEHWQDGSGGVDGLGEAISVAVSPDGANVYVASRADNAVAVFDRDPSSGKLTYLEVEKDGMNGVDGLAGATSVAVSPDGAYVYVAGFGENALAYFGRDSGSGELSFFAVIKDGVGGVDGLAGARTVAASPDGKYVYVAGADDNALAVFRWDTSGVFPVLDYVGLRNDPSYGLAGAWYVAVSPDGAHVYVTSRDDDAVSVFSQSQYVIAPPSFVEFEKDGVNGVDGLNAARSVTVSPDGEYVYVTGSLDDAVAVFERNATSGALDFLEVKKDGVGGVEGMDGAMGVAASPDGRHVYVAGYRSDALVTFGRPYHVYLPLVVRGR